MAEYEYGGWSRERFRDGHPEDVQKLIDESVKESHSLEYKDGRLFEDDAVDANHEVVAQISGFANSGGGVLMVGVQEDKKTHTATKVTGKLKPIEMQWIADVLANGIEPSVDPAGYLLRSFPDPEESDRTCYVLYVPQSPRAPHMVISKGRREGRYWCRGHAGIQWMPDWQVRDVMGHRQRPDLVVEQRAEVVPVKLAGDVVKEASLGVWLTLLNHGTAASMHTQCVLRLPTRPSFEPSGDCTQVPVPDGSEERFMWCPPVPVIPGSDHCLKMDFELKPPDGRSRYLAVYYEAALYTENAPPRVQCFGIKASWSIDPPELSSQGRVECDRIRAHLLPHWEWVGPLRIDELP